MLKRFWVIAICALFIISTLTGCNQETPQGKPGGDAPVVVAVWYDLKDKEEEELLRQLERISRENDQVLVRGERITAPDFSDYVWKVQAGGQGPDILIADIPTIAALYSKGAISPAFAQSNSGIASVEGSFTFNNKLYAVPWLTDAPILYYRKDLVKELPDNLDDIFTKKQPIVIRSLSTDILGPWWKAERGSFSLGGIPQLDSDANKVFLEKILDLQDSNLLIVDDKPLDRLVKGEANYAITWASERYDVDNNLVDFKSLEALAGRNARSLLDKSIGIANSSMITDPDKEGIVRLVMEELLALETQTSLMVSGQRIPASKEFYQQPKSTFNSEVLKTIDNSLILPGNHLDWRLIGILDTAWRSVFAGEDIESELEKAQQSGIRSIE